MKLSLTHKTNLERLAPLGTEEEKQSFRRRIGSPAFWLTFIILAAAWVILSGRFDSFHLGLGVISCLLVSYYSSDLLFSKPLTRAGAPIAFSFLKYLPWLLTQVCLANWHVLKICLSFNIMEKIDPHLVTFQSTLKGDHSLVTLANSITLTPGTITVRVNVEGEYVVHAIDRQVGDMAALREMEAKVAQAFREVE